MPGQVLALQELEVLRLRERHRMPPEQRQPAAGADLGHHPIGRIGIDAVGQLAAQPQDDRLVGRVPLPGQGQRAIEQRLDPCRALQEPQRLQLAQEPLGRPHRPHRVRAGGADPDLEQVERAQRHHDPPDQPAPW